MISQARARSPPPVEPPLPFSSSTTLGKSSGLEFARPACILSAVTVVDLAQQLVRIPSVNPENDPGTEQTGEARLAEFLGNHLASLAVEVMTEEVKPGRPNLIARFAAADGRPRILLGPHLDTVGVSGMVIPPFSGEIRDARLWGRGASDTKGPMAAMLHALETQAERLRDAPVAVDFVGFMGEESAQWGSRHFAAHHATEYEFALVGEPTSLNIVHTTKGSLWVTLRSSGRAAHSSQPERGDNAIWKLLDTLHALRDPLAARLANFSHPLLGPSTLNLGTISGGSRPNIVPDAATAEMDIRTTPDLFASGGALKLLQEALAGAPVEIAQAAEKPPMEIPADHPWIRRLQTVRPASRCVGAPWFSDAAHLSHAGLPAICIGPGRIDQAHTADEFIAVADLEAGAAFFHDFLSSLLAR